MGLVGRFEKISMSSMREIGSKELKCIQLGILQNVADFCDKHEIRYFLADGTLLGAIRHNGYIPWDDDIDIAMPRPEYERFIRIFKDDNSRYQVVSVYSDKQYGIPLAKVHDTRTLLHETLYKKDVYGVYIDVYPLDGIKNKYQIKTLVFLNKVLHAKKANFTQRKLSKMIINFFGKLLLLPFSTHALVSFIDKIAQKYKYGSTPYAGEICDGLVGERAMVNYELFEDTLPHEFEGRIYKIPIGYDKWLRSLYDDYMQLPPIEERKSLHLFKAWWKDSDI